MWNDYRLTKQTKKKNKNCLRNILGIMLIIIFLTSKAGADMDNLKITRLGKVAAGKIVEESYETETNYPEPIVLWNRDSVASVLYFSSKEKIDSGTLKQRIDYLETPEKANKSLLKTLFDGNDYPIKFSARGIMRKEDELTMNNIEIVLTADINGDGVDELIIIKHLGEVEVYNIANRIFSFKPSVKPRLFEYSMDHINTITLESHDEIFFVFNRDLLEDIDALSKINRAYYKSTLNSKIIRVGLDGITEIKPSFPKKFKPETIKAVCPLNIPGSTTLDELIVISEVEDEKGYFISRHKMDGTSLDIPRKFYADPFELSEYKFIFAPQSSQFIALSLSDKKLYFITPDKSVNWIKKVDLEKLPKSRDYIDNIGVINKNGIPVIYIKQHENIYAIDANGKYHLDKNGTIGKDDTPVPITTIKPESKYHKIHKVFPVGKNMDEFLAIQTRMPQKKELSEEELEWAGERFLSDSDWEICKYWLKHRYDEDIHDRCVRYCRDNKTTMPVINSLEDIKTKLPGYYDKMVKDSKRRYYISLNTRLFRPIEGENCIIKDGDYKKMDEYKTWLKNAFLSPELILSTHAVTGENRGTGKVDGYFYESFQSGLDISPFNAKVTGKHWQVIMTLKKKILDQDFEPAYYSITW